MSEIITWTRWTTWLSFTINFLVNQLYHSSQKWIEQNKIWLYFNGMIYVKSSQNSSKSWKEIVSGKPNSICHTFIVICRQVFISFIWLLKQSGFYFVFSQSRMQLIIIWCKGNQIEARSDPISQWYLEHKKDSPLLNC